MGRIAASIAATAMAAALPVFAGTTEYEWDLPLGLPAPLVPADNPMSAAKVELGQRLFFDERLSGNGRLSCAGCHDPELAFTDGRPRALGATGELHSRSSMSLVNSAYGVSLGWADPSVVTVEQQIRIALYNESPVEMGVTGNEDVVEYRLQADPELAAAFRSAFPEDLDPVTVERSVQALASYVRTIVSADSAFDRLLFRDDAAALRDEARRGMALFFSDRLNCSACHAGFNFAGAVVHAVRPQAEPDFHNTGLADEDPGLAAATGLAADRGRFRAPTLRNIALTAPYMHDGRLETLESVIAHYAEGAPTAPNPAAVSPLLTGFTITPGETADLVAFLHSLTDEDAADRATVAPAPPPNGQTAASDD